MVRRAFVFEIKGKWWDERRCTRTTSYSVLASGSLCRRTCFIMQVFDCKQIRPSTTFNKPVERWVFVGWYFFAPPFQYTCVIFNGDKQYRMVVLLTCTIYNAYRGYGWNIKRGRDDWLDAYRWNELISRDLVPLTVLITIKAKVSASQGAVGNFSNGQFFHYRFK